MRHCRRRGNTRDGLDGTGAAQVGKRALLMVAKHDMADIAEVVAQGVA